LSYGLIKVLSGLIGLLVFSTDVIAERVIAVGGQIADPFFGVEKSA
jgi:hypothetical protein